MSKSPYNMDPEKGGIKRDEGKLRLELVPPEAILALGAILTHGASKYEDRNWEKGMPLERIYGALQRHLQAWASGVEIDPESGFPHLEHALCNLAMMVTLRRRAFIGTGSGPAIPAHPREDLTKLVKAYEKERFRMDFPPRREHRDYTDAEWDKLQDESR